ncbi:hypothetical protein DMR_12110 [Solidesulfovibrio magneticus RS-1]|uniref:Uncharacterized protein n=2 Tax=Solidesulfovibrio TaxID=2910984 RepID=C4XLW4_SOLM1|nr:hypothetical protein DMR_12110 [Solidesulfovibrio magneticus RS-1]
MPSFTWGASRSAKFSAPGGMGMSIQAIGQDNANSWLAQMLASYTGQTSSAASSLESLLGTGSTTSDDTASSSASSSTASVGSFNDILQALLSGNGSVGYDMTTGTLTDLSGSTLTGVMGPPPPGEGMDGISREVTETENEDGSLSRSVTMTDADGNVVGTETTTQNADGSYSTVMTMVQADGTTTTRTMTGAYDADGNFVEKNTLTAADGTVLESGTVTTAQDGSFTSTMTVTDAEGRTSTRTASGEYADDGSFTVISSLAAADGTILETGTETTAADGSYTSTVTRTGPDGNTVTETASYDAEGTLLSSSTSTTTSGSGATASSDSSSGSSGSSSSSSDSEETTTTVTTAFTTEGMEQTTVVTDADGNIVSKTVKEFPFSADAEGQSFGATEASKDGLSSMLDQYAKGRYGADRYAAMAASGESGGQSGFSAQA